MKITFCTYDAPGFTGGPNSWLRRILPDLRKADIDCQILFFIDSDSSDRCPCWQDLYQQGFACKAYFRGKAMFEQVRWLLAEVAKEPPDIFVTNLSAAGLYAGRWFKEAGIPTVGILHSDDPYYRAALQKFVFGNASEQLSTLVCVSDFLTQYAHSFGETTTDIHCIPYGVPIPDDIASPAQDTLKMIYVGRLVEEQKQISQVTTAMCQAVQEVSQTEAILYGNGPDKLNAKQIIATQGQGLPIKLGGQIDSSQIQDVMLKAQVLVLLSDYEGLPIALMEAMACGLVPICLDIRSGIPELIEDGITGLLVQDRGDGFVKAVKRLRKTPELWQTLSTQTRSKIKQNYSHDACTQKWIKVLKDLKPATRDAEVIREHIYRGYRVLRYLNNTLSVT